VIHAAGLEKDYGEKRVLRGLDFELERGGFLVVTGANGSGKTTLLRLCAGLAVPTGGTLEVEPGRGAIGFLGHEPLVYLELTALENLDLYGRLYRVPERRERIGMLLERFGLWDSRRERAAKLSRGQLQRLALCRSLLHRPELLILDEPFSGLDPVSMRQLREQIIAEHARGATILFSTHVMQQAEEICDHVVMIHRGRKMLDDPVSSIRSRYDPRALVLEPLDAGADVAGVRALAGVESCERHEGAYNVELGPGVDVASAISRIAAALPVARIEVKRPRLEDVFVQIVTDRGDSPDAARALRAELADQSPQAAT
jgi:ABC-2 type transport system ATP-binding protein